MTHPRSFTTHALKRCRNRSIDKEAVEAALEFGRCRFGRRVEIFTLRWRDPHVAARTILESAASP